jgi:hypothetical protein
MSEVRRATVLDMREMIEIAQECYAQSKGVSVEKAVEWGEKAMLNPNMAFFRTEDAWGCVAVAEVFYLEGPKATMMFLAARNGKAWEACKVLRAMIAWSRSKGASSFHFGEDTGMRMDVMAKRVGAVVDRPTYTLKLRSEAMEFWKKAS